MKQRLLKVAKYAAYPALYVFCLLFFFYLTFPMRSLQSRIAAEFERQQKIGAPPGQPVIKLDIGDISTYWFTGVELSNVRLTVPPKADKPKPAFPGLDAPAKDAPKPSTLLVERVRARVRMLPLLVGNVKIDFRVDAFGGRIEGNAPYASPGNVEAEIEGIHLDQIEPLRAMVQGQPLFGVVRGSIFLAPEEGKFAKASGKLDLAIDDVAMFDGKSKLFGVALPRAQIGRIVLSAKADKGQMTIEEMGAHGGDLEIAGEGKVRINESYKRSLADVFLKFKFADSYRDKDDATRGLLGKPGQKYKPAIELDPDKTMVRAKTEDEFYRFHLSGRLDKLEVEPAGAAAGPPGAKTAPGRPPFASGGAPMVPRGGMRGGEDAPAAPPAPVVQPPDDD